MKQVLITLTIMVLAAITYGQEYIVLDSSLVQDAKQQTIQRYIERMNEQVYKIADAEKVSTGEIKFRQETALLLQQITQAVNAYNIKLLQVDTVKLVRWNQDFYENGDTTRLGVIAERQMLLSRVEQLKTDPEIKHLDAVEEYKRINKRLGKFNNWAKQIKGK